MTSLIAMVSLLLSIVLLIAVFQLFKQIQSIKFEKQEDIDNVLRFYLDEIKEENIKLQESLKQKLNTNQNNEINDNAHDFIKPLQKDTSGYDEVKQPEAIEDNLLNLINEEEVYEPSLANQIFQYKSKGLSTEEISRKLKCGKTEVDLILKLRK